MQHKKVVMDNKEIQSGRKILDMAIKDQSRKRDAEQLEEVQAIKDKNNRKKKKTKKQKNSTPDNDSISTIKSDDPEIIKRRKAKIRRNKERIDSLGLGKNKKASKKKEKNNIIKPVSEEIIEIIQHKKFQNGKIKIKVKWDNGETEWCDNIDAVKKDFPDLVKNILILFQILIKLMMILMKNHMPAQLIMKNLILVLLTRRNQTICIGVQIKAWKVYYVVIVKEILLLKLVNLRISILPLHV